LTVTFEYAGRRVHLARQVSDCDQCDNHERHVRLDPRALSPMELARVLVHEHRRADLRAVLVRFDALHDLHRTPDRGVVDRIDWLVRTGRLVAIECRLPIPTYTPDLPPAPVEPMPAFAPSKVTEPDKTWVGIAMVDDEGKPVPGQKYRVKTPDGVVHEGTLDAQGKAMISNLDPGNCEISFPDIDGKEWKAV
jgi:hypothetical protein